jgi:hypothetical protein
MEKMVKAMRLVELVVHLAARPERAGGVNSGSHCAWGTPTS